MPPRLRNNSLTLAMLTLFLFAFGGQVVTGHAVYNEDQQEHGQEAVGLGKYLTTGHFIEATFENWESEFLQMGVYVLLTAFLLQKGSSESKDPDNPDKDRESELALDGKSKAETKDEDKQSGSGEGKASGKSDGGDKPDATEQKRKAESNLPGWARRGAGRLLYENSLCAALLSLFLLSFVLHLYGGARAYNEEQIAHGQTPGTILSFLGSSQFWFQSFQNWQSEFLSIGVLIVLSIYLRQKGSPESKPVGAPNEQTGD